MTVNEAAQPDSALTEEERQLTIPPEDDVPEHDDDPELLR